MLQGPKYLDCYLLFFLPQCNDLLDPSCIFPASYKSHCIFFVIPVALNINLCDLGMFIIIIFSPSRNSYVFAPILLSILKKPLNSYISFDFVHFMSFINITSG